MNFNNQFLYGIISFLMIFLWTACSEQSEDVEVPINLPENNENIDGSKETTNVSQKVDNPSSSPKGAESAPEFNWSLKDSPDEKKDISVTVDKSNVSVVTKDKKADPEVDNVKSFEVALRLKTPEDCMAKKVMDLKHQIFWQPLWRLSGMQSTVGPWLISADISEDGSVLAIIERTGEDQGPYGSRLILVNTYDFTILRVWELPNYLISKILIQNKRHSIIALCDAQPKLKQSRKIIEIAMMTGKIKGESIGLNKPVDQIILSSLGNRLFVKITNSTEVIVLRLDSLSSAVTQSLVAPDPHSRLAISKSDSTLLMAGNGQLVFYDDKRQLLPVETKTLKDNGKWDEICCLGNKSKWIFMRTGSVAQKMEGENVREVHNAVGKIVFFDQQDNRFFIEQELKHEIHIFDAQSLKNKGSFCYNNIVPRNKAGCFYATWLPNRRQVCYIDQHGNISILHQRNVLWSKKIALTAKQ